MSSIDVKKIVKNHLTWLKVYLVLISPSSLDICSRNKSQQAKKSICHSVPKTFDFSQNSFVPFYQVTFDHSISGVLLIDKLNESCQNLLWKCSRESKRNIIFLTILLLPLLISNMTLLIILFAIKILARLSTLNL